MLEQEEGCVATKCRVFRSMSHESGCLECSCIRIMIANPGRLRVLFRARVDVSFNDDISFVDSAVEAATLDRAVRI